MTLSTSLLAAVLSLSMVSSAAAQHMSQHYRNKDTYPGVAYGVGDNPRTYVGPLEPGEQVALQLDTVHAAAIPMTMEAFVADNGSTIMRVLEPMMCAPIPGGLDCVAPLPADIRDAWPTLTGVRVAFTETLPDVGTKTFYSNTMAVQLDPVPPLTCKYTPLGSTVEELRPLNSAIGGYRTGDLQAAADRIGQLRRDGWRVEWQFIPATGLAGAGSADRIVVQAWCFGK